MKYLNIFWVLALMICFSTSTLAQRKKKRGEKIDSSRVEANKLSPVDKYKKFLSGKEIVDEGLFRILKETTGNYYFEIPDSLISREMLLATKISGFVEGLLFGGAGMAPKDEYVIRWDKLDSKIYLKAVSYRNIANEEQPVSRSIKYNNFEPIIKSFDIEVASDIAKSTIINVTDLFTTDVDILGPLGSSERTNFKIKGLDKGRSGITSVKSFPQNVEVRHFLTYSGDKLPVDNGTGSMSVELNQSFVLLPRVPMVARLRDDRVGYFSLEVVDYSDQEQRAQHKRFINRWRLEPKDWDAFWRGELVEPVKPIVYFLDPSTPVKYRKYLKQGIEDWQLAFESIGFKNAIIAKDPPTPEEDPEWSPEDIRYSVVRYITTEIVNAQGPHVHDPRSGEIIESDIMWYSNVITWLRTLTMIQTGAINPNGRKPKLSDEDMGKMVRYVIAHEVGHTLGLPHNFCASSAYPVDSLRSPSFTKKWGITSSIMEYARANYVAQPGDGDVHLLNDKIGPYDLHAIKYGYMPIRNVKTPEDELKTLNQWILEKAGDPKYRYGRQTSPSSHIDPSAQNEDLGDNSVKASTYGLMNLKRIIPKLIEWNYKDGSTFQSLGEAYDDAISQWYNYNRHVVHNIGGVYSNPKKYGQEGPVFEYLPKERQVEAMKFLTVEAFQSPWWLLDKEINMRLVHGGAITRIQNLQANYLNMLLDDSRLARLIEYEAFEGNKAYTLNEMLDELRMGLWSELKNNRKIDVMRRNLQKTYIAQLDELMTNEQKNVPADQRFVLGNTPVKVSESDIRSIVRSHFMQLKREIGISVNKVGDKVTKQHLQDCSNRIDLILNRGQNNTVP